MTLWIRKEQAGNASGGLSWPTDGAVIPVHDDDLARELLWIPGFSEVSPPAEAAVTEPDPDAHAGPDAENATPAPDPAAKPPKAGQKRRITE